MKIYGLLEPYISYLYRRPQVDINSNIGKFYYHYHNILILSLFLFSFILFISWPFLDNIGIPPFIIEVLNISSHSYIYSFYILATIICTAFAAIATYLYRIKFGTEKSLLSPLYKVYYNINLPLSYVAINLLVGVVRRVIGLIYSVVRNNDSDMGSRLHCCHRSLWKNWPLWFTWNSDTADLFIWGIVIFCVLFSKANLFNVFAADLPKKPLNLFLF